MTPEGAVIGTGAIGFPTWIPGNPTRGPAARQSDTGLRGTPCFETGAGKPGQTGPARFRLEIRVDSSYAKENVSRPVGLLG